MINDYRPILKSLQGADARFIVVGGMAAVSHGSAHVTFDLDICYLRTPENIDAMARALAPLHPCLRGAPAGLPFVWDNRTITAGLNFTLVTDLGDLDLLGELAPRMTYPDLLPGSIEQDLFGYRVRIIGLDDLIRAKEVAGRPKDLIHAAELKEIRRMQGPATAA